MDMHHLELDIACYATAVYHEVNTRTLEEKVGVINVIRNRLHSGLWGNSVCAVVYANNQFAVQDQSHSPVNEKAYLETKLLVIDTIIYNKYANPVANALYFHDDSIPPKKAWFGRKKVIHIKRMVFY
jgi:spore germination cell wall hydrolase CwlJ-like protein